MQRRRIGDRVQAVERVWEIDHAALLPDRRDRVGHRQPALDLLLEEEPDDLTFLRLDLLAGNDHELAVAGKLEGLLGSGEDVVVGDRDRTEPLCLRVVEEVGDRHRAVVRVIRVHVQVGEDERPVREGLRGCARHGAPPTEHGLVERLELVGERLGAKSLRRAPHSLGLGAPPLGVGGEPAERGAHELGLLLSPRRVDEGDAGGGGLCAEAADPALSRDEAGGTGEEPRSTLAVEGRAHGHAVTKRARNVGAAGERARAHEDELPVRQISKLPQRRPGARQLVGTPLEEEAVRRPRVSEAVELDAFGQSRVVAREPLARCGEGLLADGGQAVDP